MEKIIFEYNEESENYISKSENLDKIDFIKKDLIRDTNIGLPNISEVSLVRHFTNLSKLNYGVDNNFYPLGSCTMKYNPKVNESLAKSKNITSLHPLIDTEYIQGILELLYEFNLLLQDISGMSLFTLQPVAGAHGEITGNFIIKKYHTVNKNFHKNKIIIPDSAHGTNPATVSIAGFEVVEIKSDENGNVDIVELEKVIDDTVAGMMITNPNTLGLFDTKILKIRDMIHSVDGLLYYDGANLNPLLGKIKISDMGFDIVHFNLHKSFSTPHGGGGPGSGPVGVVEKLKDFLPVPIVNKDNNGNFYLNFDLKNSIGKVHSFYGNINVVVKAFAYIKSLGLAGLKAVGENSVLKANYLKEKLKKFLKLPYDRICMHEFVLSGEELNQYGIHTIDIAKRFIDYGYHPPTVYFPLIVKEAIMIEPTETESKETLDKFAADFEKIIDEAKNEPDKLKNSSHKTPVSRLDETQAARNPILVYK